MLFLTLSYLFHECILVDYKTRYFLVFFALIIGYNVLIDVAYELGALAPAIMLLDDGAPARIRRMTSEGWYEYFVIGRE